MNKKLLFSLLFLTLPATANEQQWNGTVLGFEPAPKGIFGDMLGIRPILSDHGFSFHSNY